MPNLTRTFALLSVIHASIIILANIASTKFTYIWITEMPIDAGFIFFPMIYVLNDICTEVLGARYTYQMIRQGVLVNILIALCIALVLALPSHPEWQYEESFQVIFAGSVRIFAASVISYVIGASLNTFILTRLRKINLIMGVRFMMSTSIGALIETMLFYVIAFYGSMPDSMMLQMASVQYLLKITYELAFMPLIYAAVNQLSVSIKKL